MTLGELWRYIGPASAVIVPVGLVAASGGIPSGTWWDEPKDPAAWILGTLIVTAMINGLLSLRRAPEERRATVKADLERLARRAFVPVNRHLGDVPINALGVHVWATDGDKLKRLVKYTMEQERVETPISWARGKGVIGLAWERKQAVVADLTELYEQADQLSDDAFGQLHPDVRYGLTAEEVKRGGRYKSVLAYPLTATASNDVIGVLSVDCTVAGHDTQLEELLEDRDFQDVLGSCESTLRRYLGR